VVDVVYAYTSNVKLVGVIDKEVTPASAFVVASTARITRTPPVVVMFATVDNASTVTAKVSTSPVIKLSEGTVIVAGSAEVPVPAALPVTTTATVAAVAALRPANPSKAVAKRIVNFFIILFLLFIIINQVCPNNLLHHLA
jgi:hypothetical protein